MKQILFVVLAALLLACPAALAAKKKTVTVTYNPAKTDKATLVKAFEKLGYTAKKKEPVTVAGSPRKS